MATAATPPNCVHSANEPFTMTGDTPLNLDAEKQAPDPVPEKEQSSAFKALSTLR